MALLFMTAGVATVLAYASTIWISLVLAVAFAALMLYVWATK